MFCVTHFKLPNKHPVSSCDFYSTFSRMRRAKLAPRLLAQKSVRTGAVKASSPPMLKPFNEERGEGFLK